MSRISLGGGRSVSMRNYVKGSALGGGNPVLGFLFAERFEKADKDRQQNRRGDHGRR